jgi:hypothetical protein
MVDENLEQRLTAWWDSLDQQQQSEATSIDGDVPEWMARSLQEIDVLVVDADMNGDGHVHLLPTIVREFLDRRSVP